MAFIKRTMENVAVEPCGSKQKPVGISTVSDYCLTHGQKVKYGNIMEV
jgi:hypothetical protein